MKFWKFYRKSIYTSVLYFFLYIIVLWIVGNLLNPPASATIFWEEYLSYFFVAIFLIFTMLNNPFTSNSFSYEMSLSLLLPIKKWQIVISRFLKDGFLLLIFQFISLIGYLFIVNIDSSYLILEFNSKLLSYIFTEFVMITVLQPVFIAFRKSTQKNLYTVLLLFCFYFGVPFVFAEPLQILYHKIKIFESICILTAVSLAYIAVLMVISFIISYRILSNSDF